MHSNCTYLSYSGGSCSLHSNLTDDFNLKYRSVSGLKQLVLLKERSLDTGGVGAGCSEEMPLEGSAVSYFRSCLHHSRLEAQIRTEHLPPLAIVLSVTEDWPLTRRAGFAAVVSNFQCYCDRHGYSFVSTDLLLRQPYSLTNCY